ncbi:hypothetical protein SHIRM173S_01281 [Streptomyces hirsutus]
MAGIVERIKRFAGSPQGRRATEQAAACREPTPRRRLQDSF